MVFGKRRFRSSAPNFDTTADRIFIGIVYVLMVLVAIVMLYPLWDQFVLSLSTRQGALSRGLRLFPNPPTVEAYRQILSSNEVWRSFNNTLIRVVTGTFWGVFITALTSYPLSRDNFPFRRTLTLIILFTMLFGGGLIPDYLLRKNLGLLNTRLVLILPGIAAFNVIIMRNFYRSLPRELEEAAQIDGASDWGIWWRIVLPLSKPVLATIGLWIAVTHWNAYLDALIYITDRDKYVLQVVLRRILLEGQVDMFLTPGMDGAMGAQRPTPETVKAALVMVSTLPIVAVYPFLQRYFIKGTLLGAVKS